MSCSNYFLVVSLVAVSSARQELVLRYYSLNPHGLCMHVCRKTLFIPQIVSSSYEFACQVTLEEFVLVIRVNWPKVLLLPKQRFIITTVG